MSEFFRPSQCIQVASAEFLPNHSDHSFSPESIDRIRFSLQQNNVDLETPRGIDYFIKLSQILYSPNDPDHGWHHIDTVIQNSLFLAHLYNLHEQEVYALLAAACLHDVIRYDVQDPAQCSAEIAQQILPNHMQPDTVQWTVDAIAQHSSASSRRYANNVVTKMIYDADKLHTHPSRWVNCGLNPLQFQDTDIERAYQTSLEEIHGTIATYPAHHLIEKRMRERQALKNASGY